MEDPCTTQEDCADEFYCPDSEQCQPTVELGQPCVDDVECGSGYCSNEHCSPDGFAYVPAGAFCMGSPGDLEDWDSEGCPDADYPRNTSDSPYYRLHEVTLTHQFFLQETEVTQNHWLRVFDENPSFFEECGLDCPVNGVTWWAALRFANSRSQAEVHIPVMLDGSSS